MGAGGVEAGREIAERGWRGGERSLSSGDFGSPPHPPAPPREGDYSKGITAIERNNRGVRKGGCVCVFSKAPRAHMGLRAPPAGRAV